MGGFEDADEILKKGNAWNVETADSAKGSRYQSRASGINIKIQTTISKKLELYRTTQ
jgi:hypothetical protein